MSISLGNKIELIKLEQVIRNDANKQVYISKVYDILDDGVLQIAMPIYDGKIVPLPVNEKFSANFYTEKGLLQCNIIITSRYKSGNLFFMDIALLSELRKVQRRAYYRYNCLLDAKIRTVSEHEYATGKPDMKDDVPVEVLWNPVKILDISGGGARITSKVFMERNTIVKISFVLMILDDVAIFDLYANILASTPIKNRPEFFEQRMEFMKIGQDERDKIIRFIFESERMARAKKIGLK
ncbi:MAG: flagellar brake domain-containing protein [Eubacteriales bacterium]|nr:flagellar brake domain-containing protein [Lachnospiraceae bacterium]MDO5128109.1 flagellar brake domain-containing protein [Eubacteriales bacterium]